MACNIIGCGKTGSSWDGKGDSIGVNDCGKFGHPVDYLMVINSPDQFTPERQQIIKETRLNRFITDNKSWLRRFWPEDVVNQIKLNGKYKELFSLSSLNHYDLTRYRFSQWTGTLRNDRISYAHTSPFAAASLAYLLGYSEIIFWGVDFLTHRTWRGGNEGMITELAIYKNFCEQLNAKGVLTYVGAHGSLLEKFLSIKS